MRSKRNEKEEKSQNFRHEIGLYIYVVVGSWVRFFFFFLFFICWRRQGFTTCCTRREKRKRELDSNIQRVFVLTFCEAIRTRWCTIMAPYKQFLFVDICFPFFFLFTCFMLTHRGGASDWCSNNRTMYFYSRLLAWPLIFL